MKKSKTNWEPTPADFEKAFKAVGEFLFHWAAVEFQINQLIAKGLRLSPYTSIAVTANVQFRDKLHICATIVALQYRSEDWQEDAVDWLEKARKVALNRNTAVHNFFAPYEHGVRFFASSARGKIETEPTEWRYADFRAKILKMARICDAIKIVVQDVSPPVGLAGLSSLGASFSAYDTPLPRPTRGLLSALSRELHQAPEAPRSDAPNRASDDETLSDPLEGLNLWMDEAQTPTPSPPPKKLQKRAPSPKKKTRKNT